MQEKIRFRNVSKSYNGSDVLKDVSFSVGEGETLVLIGTSGCGKTTTLKMINRLTEPTGGGIEVNGRDLSSYEVTDLRRGIGYVVQSIGLFPHMSVKKNISIVPDLMGWPGEKVASRVDELLGMVGLDPGSFRERYPGELSGGQQQRVGVARALAADPPIILMDEPFGALDPITREGLQNELADLLRKIRKTVVFVTHDIFEAAILGDRIALMDGGRLVQTGRPKEIVENPANSFVVEFLGKHRFQLSLLLTDIAEVTAGTGTVDLAALEGIPSLAPDSTVLDALNYFKRYDHEVIPVKEDGEISGVVTKGEVRQMVCGLMQVHDAGVQ
ncbi:MAG: ABC transporter ATP-binding protein [Candidatus Sulfobium sp.]